MDKDCNGDRLFSAIDVECTLPNVENLVLPQNLLHLFMLVIILCTSTVPCIQGFQVF